MPFVPFALERLLSRWEHEVEINLSESGVEPASLAEILEPGKVAVELLEQPMGYPHTRGNPQLRSAIAALYPGAQGEHVLVSNGCAEANFNAVRALLEQGGALALMEPNYMQIRGVAQEMGVQVRPFHLNRQKGWELDLDSLDGAVREDTRLIAVCDPNNPTGHVLSAAEREAILSRARAVGAWVLVDEIYRGLELSETARQGSFWGSYDKLVVTNSLSKAYGLAGLRIGWTVGPPDMVEEIWARQDYTTICASAPGQWLARAALAPSARDRLLQRAQQLARDGYGQLAGWVEANSDLVDWVPPQAGSFALVHAQQPMDAVEWCERLIAEKSVFVVPGDYCGVPGAVRIGFGAPGPALAQGLERLADFLGSSG
jgi:aspartate/methionine/tyrosine aminotransferase